VSPVPGRFARRNPRGKLKFRRQWAQIRFKRLTITVEVMPVVKFIKENKEVEVPRGTNLRKAAISAGVNLYQGLNGTGAGINQYLNCHGFGQCGMCRVLITKGMENASPMGLMEKTRFKCPVPTPVTPLALDPIPCMAYIGHEETMRLACKTSVLGDMEVETGPEINLFGDNFFS
jgi:ferredoxin